MPSISDLTDDFNTGTVPDPAQWDSIDWQINGGDLYLHTNSLWTQAWLVSKDTYSMPGGHISMQLKSMPGAYGCELFVTEDWTTWGAWNLRNTGTKVRADVAINQKPYKGNITHTSGNRYRIRETSGNLLFEYSKNGTTWILVHTEPLTNCLPAGGANTSVSIVGETQEFGSSTVRVSGVNV